MTSAALLGETPLCGALLQWLRLIESHVLALFFSHHHGSIAVLSIAVLS